MGNRIAAHRRFYADLIAASARVPESQTRLREAFASIPRERFMGPGPWKVYTAGGQVTTPTDDPAFLYQDILVSLKAAINNGQPSLHAASLAALEIEPGEAVVHVGAGTGYYTAILAALTGTSGSVSAFEIDEELAARAAENLRPWAYVEVHARSGSEPPIPTCNVVYVSAGATEPLPVWLDALSPSGRLLFPMTPAEGFGGMLRVVKKPEGQYGARFISGAMFIPCLGARDEQTAQKLTAAFRTGNMAAVQSLHRNEKPDKSCWVAGHDWWLSTE